MASVRRKGRIMLIVMLIPVFCLLVMFGVLLFLSPGKPEPLLTENGQPIVGSISEKLHVNINGVDQGMFIKGKNRDNPVLLFVHGGTGMPEYFLARNYPTGIEDYFTVCWWERRGAGLSYRSKIPQDTITVEQMVSDTLEVANYLRQRFHKDKVFLMAHSGGTFIAAQAAARSPELFHAYVAVGQMSFQLDSERTAYEYMLRKFKEMGNKSMVRRLEEVPTPLSVPLPPSYMAIRDKAMHRLGVGTTRDMKSVISGVFLASLTNPEYTVGEKLNIWRGKMLCDRLLWNTMLSTDLSKQVTRLDLPVYFFHGQYDYTVSYSGAKSYFEMIQAPVKGFYTFEKSAHSPLFEEPEKVKEIFQVDVLVGTNRLSDIL